jgi:hypothetical protein
MSEILLCTISRDSRQNYKSYKATTRLVGERVGDYGYACLGPAVDLVSDCSGSSGCMLKAARLRPAPQAITVDTTVGACSSAATL